MLIVLDNAATAAQVTPLLPRAAGCLVMVTRRRRLAGLPADTREVSLDMLPAADAVTRFTRFAGPDRTAGEPDGLVVEVVELCWRLPLAVSIAATLLRSHPAWTVADLIDRLRDGHQRLAELADGPRSVTVVLQVSYQHFATDLRRLYRLRGLHPGPHIDPYPAAALAGTTVARARQLLDQLLDERLLQEPAPGRYVLHDPVRGHATTATTEPEPEPDRQAALTQLLDYYRHTATTTVAIAYPHHRDYLPRLPALGTPVPELADPARATRWLDTELSNLLAVTHHGADHGCPESAVHLSSILRRHLAARGRRRIQDRMMTSRSWRSSTATAPVSPAKR
jgi:hypothetical protein